jgi:hypothetical protein
MNPLLVPKSPDSKSVSGMAPTFSATKGAFFRAVGVQQSGHQFLAVRIRPGSRRNDRLGDVVQALQSLHHRIGLADDLS